MKRIFLLLFALVTILTACTASQDKMSFDDKPKLESDTIRISNKN